MTDSYYIGATELVFQECSWIQPNQWDIKFRASVLPVLKKISVNYYLENELTFPEGQFQRFSSGKVWVTEEGEFRSYCVGGNSTPNILSFYTDVSPSVCVLFYRSYWEKAHIFLRPFFQIHLEELLLDNNALVLHSASILYQGKAILFTAPSGTGKTTQTNLWHQFKPGVSDINGDRTLLQRSSDIWYACGFPMFGSSFRCEQIAVPVKAVVVVRQADEDCIRELSKFEKLSMLYSEIMVPNFNRKYVTKAIDLLGKMICEIPVLQLNCTMSETAVQVLHNYLYGD